MKRELKENNKVSIIRDCSSGSNAVTLLCMEGNSIFYRKYAFGEEAEKLFLQLRWIEENNSKLSLPEIIRKEKTADYCFYDMKYTPHTVGMFEYVHSVPMEDGWKLLSKVIEELDGALYAVNSQPSDSKLIQEYYREKVWKNIKRIKESDIIKPFLSFETLMVNGIECRNIDYIEKFMSEDYLQRVFKYDRCSFIHGDLTLENIICTCDEDGMDDFYIIDPNPGNIHESMQLDYAKLLQSLHGEYEFIENVKAISTGNGSIDFSCVSSLTYQELHKQLRNYMLEKLGLKGTKSVYVHEIIHWLRLLQYKLEHDGQKALAFYAKMLLVADDVFNLYANEEYEIENEKEIFSSV